MRKTIIAGLIAAMALPTAVQAQSRGEVRRDRQELREEQRELRDAQRYGNRRDVREERRDVRDARQELREDRRDLRQNRRAHSRGYTRYVAPHRGFTYRPVYQGYNLQPQYYSQRYYAPGYRVQRNARYIRYGDDLLLVNTRNGRVLQVRRDYFW